MTPPFDFKNPTDSFYVNNNVPNPTFISTWDIANGAKVFVTNNNGIVAQPGAYLKVGVSSVFDMGGKPFILKSDATGTAAIGRTDGTILNATNVTVERHMTATRAWRIVAAPLAPTGAPTILNSWQEGNAGGNPNSGYGTWITSPYVGLGYDGPSVTASIKYWNGTAFDTIANTSTTKVTDHGGVYYLFVRGDKSVTDYVTPPNSTVLRMKGTPNMGSMSNVGTVGTTNLTLVPNPYPSSIDYQAVYNGNPGAATSDIYVMDASLGSNGAFRTVTRVANNIYQTTPSGSNADNVSSRYIRSGQAFFIPAQNTLNFTESMKIAVVPSFNIFKGTADDTTIQDLLVNMSIVDNNKDVLTDGVRIKFNKAYNKQADKEDVAKLENPYENLSILNNGNNHVIDKRGLVTATETVQLRMWNLAVNNYKFSFEPSYLNPGLSILLFDAYNNVTTVISNTQSTTYTFAVDNQPGSYDPLRFKLQFVNGPLSVADKTQSSSIAIYPNPATNRTIHLQYSDIKAGDYTISLYNALGSPVYTHAATLSSTGVSQLLLPASVATGMYNLQIVDNKNQELIQSQKIIIAD